MNKTRFLLNIMAGLALGALGTGILAAQTTATAMALPAQMVVTEEASQDSNVPVISPSEVVIVSEAGERDNVTGWVASSGGACRTGTLHSPR